MRLKLTSQKLTRKVRLAVISDTHGSQLMSGRYNLPKLLRRQQPDMILLPGDIYDDIRPYQPTDELLAELAAIAPCFYSSGNHDQRSLGRATIPERLKRLGITGLDGRSVLHRVADQTIRLSGLIDSEKNPMAFEQQLAGLSDGPDYHIVLSHRPEFFHKYAASQADLVVSGHAHGGQWRFFGRGVFSPGQGMFPRYTKGLYQLAGTSLAVSPGLMRNHLPRLFNPPTALIIELEAKQ